MYVCLKLKDFLIAELVGLCFLEFIPDDPKIVLSFFFERGNSMPLLSQNKDNNINRSSAINSIKSLKIQTSDRHRPFSLL